ncbi:hypothetical protein Sps_00735 [Shewanella psychrophila]|uniref:Glycosyltransferase RgtA/B/C/D-like domain-containing protein n=1 Tax=Shewanella psychrophila TaxID=225848 RepID=A0A1S6HK99_9GAMM|nr:hypothetical protein [Shewanella psychrophila]AQS35928.1 hypothetical protein Sps_00735 [Shewanella psychrophila]
MNKAGLLYSLRLSSLFVVIFLYLCVLLNSAMINDDYMALYTIWRMSIGHVGGVDFNIDSYTLLFDLLTSIATLLEPKFELIFLFRAIMLLMILLISCQLSYLLQIVVSKRVSFIAVIFLLICTPMYLRGLDLRPDLFILLIWLQIIIIFSGKTAILSPVKITYVGVLIGLAFLFKFKSIIIVLPLALFFIQEMIIERRNIRVLIGAIAYLLLGVGLVIISYAWMLGFDSVIQGYVVVTAKLMTSSINGDISVSGLKFDILKQAFIQDALFWIFGLIGAMLFVVKINRFSTKQRFTVCYLLLLALASVALNPHYFAYNLISLYPLLLILVAITLQELYNLLVNATDLFYSVSILLGAAYLTLSIFHFYTYASTDRLSHQAALNEFILGNTEEEQAVFAYEGIGLFRPSTFHWRTSKIRLSQYFRGDYDLWQEIKEAKPVLIILNYRLPHWLLQRDKQALFDHYIIVAPQVMAPGFSTFNQRDSYLILSGAYRMNNTRGKPCKLDDQWVEDGTILTRQEGRVKLEVGTGGVCSLSWAFSKKSINRLTTSNPHGYPYLLRSSLRFN